MIRILTLLTACFLYLGSQAQEADSLKAPYRKSPNIAPFDLLGIDSSTHITKGDINLRHKTMLMFFSPDCSHCQHQTEDMIAGMDSLKDVQIVMATYQPFEDMVNFYKKYELAKYNNIKIGRDIKYVLPPYYQMRSLPYLALYDGQGNYITHFEGNQKIATLVAAFSMGK